MPWNEVSTVSLRPDFVAQVLSGSVTVAELCRQFGISRRIGYKWLKRFHENGLAGLEDQSRRPEHSPKRTPETVEHAVLALRDLHPRWGGRKIHARLLAMGHPYVPAISTVTDILRRHGRIDPAESTKHKPFKRFEHEAPHALLQMDFKGHFAIASGRCHPLTVLDDHSRYAICLKACGGERGHIVQQALTEAFRLHGLPERMLMDNGAPWGHDADAPFTALSAWLIRLGIRVSHGRPYHPQTQGKEERFHRSLNEEVLQGRVFQDLAHCQEAFDRWLHIYNHERPHEGIGMATPASRYKPSTRIFPETLQPIEYGPGYTVRKVQGKGEISFRNQYFKIGRAFWGQPVGILPADQDGEYDVYYCAQRVARINLRDTAE
jgi:transposase InsO family protein